MTDTQPEAPTPAPQDPPAPEVPEVVTTEVPTLPEYRATPPKGTPGTGHWSVWDTQLERYVGERSATKPSAADARKLAPGGYRLIET